MSKKRNTIKDLYLDRPTSHGGWPGGHSGSYRDPKTPVNKQIEKFLKDLGLIDDDNPRARLAESNRISQERLVELIRESIVRVLNGKRQQSIKRKN